ncbi:hypothetical protein [Campylobacter estrildidarum]|nr:hypothetical protein [Campylobacter estrildidarum]
MGNYSIFFNNNKNLYFDFKIINGIDELNQVLQIFNDFKIIENTTKTKSE